jgi:hypothetical protein
MAAMTLAEGIAKLGFRKWYERRLLQSHAHLALCFVCLVGVFAAFEALTRFRSWLEQAGNVLAILACAGVGLWALRRYLFLLSTAEAIANQADCEQCQAYGRLEVEGGAQAGGRQVGVRCKGCGHRWTIDHDSGPP